MWSTAFSGSLMVYRRAGVRYSSSYVGSGGVSGVSSLVVKSGPLMTSSGVGDFIS